MRYVILIMFIAMELLTFPLCRLHAEPSQSGKIFTDNRGRNVHITRPIRRIAVNHLSVSEALKILGCWEMVVARDTQTTDTMIFDGLEQIPVITLHSGGPYSFNFEALFAAKPDILICEDIPMDGFEEMVAKLPPEIPVFMVRLNRLSTLEENILKLGKLLDKEKSAREFTQWHSELTKRLTNKTARLSASEKTRYLFKTGYGSPDDIMTFTDTFDGIAERNRIIGGINVAAGLPSTGGWVQAVNPEWLAVQKIDVIVCCDPIRDGYGCQIQNTAKAAAHRNRFLALPHVAATKASRTGNVHMISGEFFATARATVGNAYLAKWLHPELFADLKPEEIFQEYLGRFLHADVDLTKTGVFTYP